MIYALMYNYDDYCCGFTSQKSVLVAYTHEQMLQQVQQNACFLFLQCSNTVPIQYQYNTNTIPIQYQYSTNMQIIQKVQNNKYFHYRVNMYPKLSCWGIFDGIGRYWPIQYCNTVKDAIYVKYTFIQIANFGM